MNTGNEVRSILVNELGLTREYIRSIVDDIVKDVVAKRLGTVNIQHYIDKIIMAEIDNMSRDSKIFGRAEIRGYAQKAALEKVTQFIDEHLKLIV